jgi:tungstate transport system substrate-binding protein
MRRCAPRLHAGLDRGHLLTLAFSLGLALVLGLACILPGPVSAESPRPIKLATTTSTANTGLLDSLLVDFKQDTGISVEVIAVGTGVALKHGENGDVDLVLVHAPSAEEAFVAAGFGVRRIPVMWNDFIVLGPANDPAGVRNAGPVIEAFRKIAAARAPFVSRGDKSGTHIKELELWQAAGITPQGEWYIEAGQGMGACLTLANDRLAYILSDRGTFLSRADKLDLTILSQGDPLLLNPYTLIAINPTRYPDLNHAGAAKLIEWMTSERGQALIAAYKVNGQTLFNPVAKKP